VKVSQALLCWAGLLSDGIATTDPEAWWSLVYKGTPRGPLTTQEMRAMVLQDHCKNVGVGMVSFTSARLGEMCA
jgi:hypothetical protein